MSLPIKPVIAEFVLLRGATPYAGSIYPGDVFAWEPDLPYARELVVVVRLAGGNVWTRNIDGDAEHWNPEDTFREAVVPTILNPHPPTRDAGRITPLPADWPMGGA